MTYAEFLKSQGATDEDLKILDTPLARKAFDAQQAAIAAATAAGEKSLIDYKAEADKWYTETILPNYQKMEGDLTVARANEARARAAILSSQDEGLKRVAKEMGYDTAPAAPAAPASPAAPAAPAGDYITKAAFGQFTDAAGNALASLQDMVLEHMQLFPGKRLNVSELRREALAAKKDIYAFWQDKYKVQDARDAAAKAETDRHDAAMREEGAKAERERLASTYGNPDLRPRAPSANPFAARPNREAGKQPWELGDRSSERVQHATKAVLDQPAGRTN